jgi:anaerobic magnesium-protoporphyrin IX monomethyl ester cyclase
MASVLLSHPYHLALDPREAALGRPYPPLGTLVVAGALQQAGHRVVFDDPMFLADERGFSARLARAAAAGVDRVMLVADDHSVQVKQCLSSVRDAHQQMSADARDAGLPVLVTGPDVSDHPDEYVAAGATSVVVGDPVTVVAAWAAGESGLVGVHGGQGAGGRRPNSDDLAAIPRAAWELADLDRYARTWRARHGHWELNVWTARGCPYRCNWCAKPTWGRSYAVRPAAAVAEELAWLRGTVGPDRIWFTDDIFALRVDWLQQFRRAVEAHPRGPLPFRCLSRADLLRDDGYVSELAASGCDEVWLGAESGANTVLSAMDKDCSVDDIERSAVLLQRHGVRVGFFLQLGYPGETLDDVRETVSLVRRLKPDAIGVSVSYPLPGTGFHDAVQSTMTDRSWVASMDNRPLFEAPYDQAFYAAAREVLRSTWSSATAARALRDLVANPGRRQVRRVAGAAFHSARLPLVRRRMERLAQLNLQAVRLDMP